MRSFPLFGLLLASLATGCKPNLGAPQSLIGGPTILAVRGTPPEAAEGAPVSYDALAVDVAGTVAAPDIGWAQCLLPDPPAEGNDVNPGCLAIPNDAGPAPTFMAELPDDACTLFGPETAPPMKGQPATRPADPDTTGGYYQPIRAVWESANQTAFSLERIGCQLANAPVMIASQFAMTYTPNNNPTLADLLFDPAGAATPLYTAGQAAPPGAATISASQKVTLEADFTVDSAESFPVYDLVTLMLETQRESLRVSWYATSGAFAHDATGRTASETETFTEDDWTAPATPGPVYLWAVLQDDRGGVDFASAEIDVTP